ncbi:polysaccharide deacetylase family protein [Neobacillus ginsengisoli]|uniref:Peptidoglycan/xylan/chitin deacetylase (PgdA/CDA1 family) n=1 Tax=Neobacillus ginsengisoli TaxID=904295 RepID=A0ABT9XVR9_9BACI|nr:polysaccharide deacetylase family protein [Neobacillus ginsengisoli]MDQ0199668.1 peptidoglycan/xylan/chitin deacetylase (PgdA/CDA1 family) [Neobacillus ginsengisoli]
MFKIIAGMILLYVIYTIIPFLLTAGLGKGVFRRSDDPSKIAFTFDDGPDPKYTPTLLDLLKKHNIKATFFVLGSKAEKNPELILRMHNEGHLIGIHNYVHRSNWIMLPWTIRRELDYSASVVEGITGVRPIYYRPPWGLLNLFDFFIIKPYKIILWSVMAEDWKSKGGSEKVKKKLLNKINHGDVILLHDSGETFGADEDAPLNTINALHDVIKELTAKSYTCVRIDEMLV